MGLRRSATPRSPAGAPAPIDTGGPLRPVRGVLSARPDDGLFEHRRIAPDAALADLVEHYWFVRWARGGLPAHTGAGTITGVQTRLWQRDLGPAGDVLGIKFRPAGFRPWFGRSLHGLRDRALPAVEVLRVRVAGFWRSVRAPLADPPAPEYVLLP